MGLLDPYVPRIAAEWDLDAVGARVRTIDGSLVFVDISGFTALSERLARRGRVGAEQLTEVLQAVFAEMLGIAYGRGGVLLKFGGDALLLLFTDDGHPRRATEAAIAMQGALRSFRNRRLAIGRVKLSMSVGVHSGPIQLFLVGDSHRELLIAGPGASTTTRMEHAAVAGEILVSADTARHLPSSYLGDEREGGRLVRARRAPDVEDAPVLARPVAPDAVATRVPVVLRRHLASGAVEPEHRMATIAFIRYQGLDALLEGEGPEAAADALHEVVTTVQEAVDAEGVTFLATDIDEDGGKIILTAGVPGGLDDGEGRVLRAARRILDTDLPLRLHLGVNRGHVFAGDIGIEFRRTYTVMGDTVNLAARLMAAAPAGQCYASPDALDRSRTIFGSVRLEPFPVKGKAEPVQAYAVLDAVGVRTESRSHLRFQGRAAELDALAEARARCRTGGLTTVLVEAERGLGKSRLVDQWAAPSGSAGAVLDLQGEPYGAGSPYLPLRAGLLMWLGLPDDGSLDAAAVTGAVQRLAPDLAPLAPLLAPVVDVAMDDTDQSAAVAPEFRADRLAALVAALVRPAATDRRDAPLIVRAEDAHWFDDATGRLLDLLARELAPDPVLVVATRRPGGDGWRPTDPATVLTLAPLEASACRALVDDATRGAPLRPVEIDELVARSGGSPLFLEELVRVARTQGLEGLPSSLDGLAATEIDALPPLARRVLRTAAVLGRVFETQVLLAVLAEEDDELVLDEATLRLLARFLVADGPERFRFRHALQLEAAYESLSFGRRRLLHERAARAIERRAMPRPEAVAELLSLHFSRAGEWDAAGHYALVAAREAQQAHAMAEAAVQLERVVEAARRGDAPDGVQLDVVWEQLGDARDAVGAFAEADDAYRRAAALCTADPVRVAELLDKRVLLAGEHQHRNTTAVRLARRGLRLVAGHADARARSVRAQLLSHEAGVRFHQGRYHQAIATAQTAVEQMAPGDEPLALASALLTLDAARQHSGQAEDAGATERALAIFERHGDLLGVATALDLLGVAAYFDERPDDAADCYRRAAAAARRAGDVVQAAVSAVNLAEVLVDTGDLDGAEALLEPAVRTLEAMQAGVHEAFALLQLGRIARERGDRERARGWIERAAHRYEASGAPDDAADARAQLGELVP